MAPPRSCMALLSAAPATPHESQHSAAEESDSRERMWEERVHDEHGT